MKAASQATAGNLNTSRLDERFGVLLVLATFAIVCGGILNSMYHHSSVPDLKRRYNVRQKAHELLEAARANVQRKLDMLYEEHASLHKNILDFNITPQYLEKRLSMFEQRVGWCLGSGGNLKAA